MLKYRLITGPILIAVLLGIVLLDQWLDTVRLAPGGTLSSVVGDTRLPPGLAMLALAIVFIRLGAREFTNIIRANGIAARRWLTIEAAMLGLVLCYILPLPLFSALEFEIAATMFIVTLVACLVVFSGGRNVQGVLAATGAVLLAMLYLGIMTGFLLLLRREHSPWWIVGVIMTTKMCDTGAYFTGRAIGRHKLIPWLSPGKTWEGLVGGVLTSGLVGMLLAWMTTLWLAVPDRLPPLYGLVCGLVFGIVGQFGDLTMSLFKRGAAMKDSSSVLPGIGGVLDVLDSPLMVAPVAYWMLAASG